MFRLFSPLRNRWRCSGEPFLGFSLVFRDALPEPIKESSFRFGLGDSLFCKGTELTHGPKVVVAFESLLTSADVTADQRCRQSRHQQRAEPKNWTPPVREATPLGGRMEDLVSKV